MIGETIQAPSRISWGAIIFLLLGAGLIALGLGRHNLHWALGSIPLLLISFCLWWFRPRGFVAHFTDDTLEVMEPRLSIPYDKLQGLQAKGRPADPAQKGPRSYPMQVFHEDGALMIPGGLNVHSDAVYYFLLERFPPGGSRAVNPALEKYLRQQEETFGPERVWAYRARRTLGRSFVSRRGLAVSLAVVAAGVLWAVIGGVLGKGNEGWIAMGCVVALLAGLVALLFWLDAWQKGGQNRLKSWREASLVISPVGLALIQGDVQGQMRWDELRGVSLRGKPKNFRLHRDDNLTGIILRFEGAQLPIVDIYDRPLAVIYQRIRDYWQP